MRGYPPDLIDLAESGLVSQPSGLVRAALLSAVHGDISFREKLHIGIISSMVSGVPATANNRECLLQVETTERGATVELFERTRLLGGRAYLLRESFVGLFTSARNFHKHHGARNCQQNIERNMKDATSQRFLPP